MPASKQADAILIIGANPRKEASLINARIRKTWRAKGLPIAVIGEQADLTYNYSYLGDGFDIAGRPGRRQGLRSPRFWPRPRSR